MLMRGNALVLKTPVENAPRKGIEKHLVHLSWSSDIPPAARFPLHRSRPAELTSGARQSLRALVMQSSAPAPGAQSTWDSALGYRGQHLTVNVLLLGHIFPGARFGLRAVRGR